MKQNQRATLVILCLGAGQALAAAGDPADATAPVPAVSYQSPFSDYRVMGEDRSTPWKDANDTVRQIGGWRAYAKEAAEAAKAGGAKPASPKPDAPPSQKAPATPAPTPHKHGG